jgi:hypothetical protein
MLRAADDCAAASWIVENLHGFAQDIGSVVPHGFDAYVRIFHPGWAGARDGRPGTWSEIARANGRVAHPEMQFHALVPEGHSDLAGNVLKGQPGVWDALPEEGITRPADHRGPSPDRRSAHPAPSATDGWPRSSPFPTEIFCSSRAPRRGHSSDAGHRGTAGEH